MVLLRNGQLRPPLALRHIFLTKGRSKAVSRRAGMPMNVTPTENYQEPPASSGALIKVLSLIGGTVQISRKKILKQTPTQVRQ